MKLKVSKWTTLVPESPGWISREVLTAAVVMNNTGLQVPAQFFDADVFQRYAAAFADLSFSAQKAPGFLGYKRLGTKDELYTVSFWSTEEAFNAWNTQAKQDARWAAAEKAKEDLLGLLKVELSVFPDLIEFTGKGTDLTVEDVKW